MKKTKKNNGKAKTDAKDGDMPFWFLTFVKSDGSYETAATCKHDLGRIYAASEWEAAAQVVSWVCKNAINAQPAIKNLLLHLTGPSEIAIAISMSANSIATDTQQAIPKIEKVCETASASLKGEAAAASNYCGGVTKDNVKMDADSFRAACMQVAYDILRLDRSHGEVIKPEYAEEFAVKINKLYRILRGTELLGEDPYIVQAMRRDLAKPVTETAK